MPRVQAKAILKKSVLKKAQARDGAQSLIKEMLEHYSHTLGCSFSQAQTRIKEKQCIAVMGMAQAGQSSLFTLSTTPFQCHFPPKETQVLQQDSSKIQWHLQEQACWIDLPDALFGKDDLSELQTLTKNLRSLRGSTPINTLVITLDVEKILAANNDQLASYSSQLQQKIAHMNRLLGYAPPVHVVATKADSLTGFNHIFGDESGRWSEQHLGMQLSEKEQQQPIAAILEKETRNLTEQIRLIEIKMLARAKDPQERRLIGRFAPALMQFQKRSNQFLTQLFTSTSGKKTNPWAGFYFTSIQSPENAVQRSWFTAPLINELISSSPTLEMQKTKESQVKGRVTVIRNSVISATVAITFVTFLLIFSGRYQRWGQEVISDVAAPISFDKAGVIKLQKIYERQKELAQLSSLMMSLVGYNSKPIEELLRTTELAALETGIAKPIHLEIEQKLTRVQQGSDNQLAANFTGLKNALRIYLAQSKAGHQFPTLYDTATLKEVLYPLVKKLFLSSITPTEEERLALDQALQSYIGMLQDKRYPYLTSTKPQLVATTQEKLVSLFDVKAVYETTIEKIRQKGTKEFLFDMLPEANEVNMNSEIALHNVYTPQAWKEYVATDLKEATTRLNSVEKWVVGDNQHKMTTSFTTPELLHKGMKELYLKDVENQWRAFLGSVKLYRYNSLWETSSVMQKLGSENSALQKIFAKFEGYSTDFVALGKEDSQSELFVKFGEGTDFFGKVNTALPSLRRLIKEAGTAVAEQRKNKTLTSVFNGSSNDPLVAGYAFIDNTLLPAMSEKDHALIRNIVSQPFEKTVNSLKKPIIEEFNAKWAPLYDAYRTQFSGRFPFENTSASDANYKATIEFFNPHNGQFWKTFSATYRHYLYARKGVWRQQSKKGLINLTISKEILTVLQKADKVKKAFYKEGKERDWKFSVRPSSTTKLKQAKLTVGETSGDLFQQPPLSFEWPSEMQKTQLLLTDKNGNPALRDYVGSWGTMKLLNRGSLVATSGQFSSTFPVQLTVRTHARQMTFKGEAAISSQYHPFAINPFNGMKFPKKIAY